MRNTAQNDGYNGNYSIVKHLDALQSLEFAVFYCHANGHNLRKNLNGPIITLTFLKQNIDLYLFPVILASNVPWTWFWYIRPCNSLPRQAPPPLPPETHDVRQ